MMKITQKQQRIIQIVLQKGVLQSSAVHAALSDGTSLVTVKRALSSLTHAGILTSSGSGRSTSYQIAVLGRIFADIDTHTYITTEPDRRYGLNRYNFDLLPQLPGEMFAKEELEMLNTATEEYRNRINDLSPTVQKKELERLIIELSWKSSKIEGNTYTLLDTEKLILEHQEAVGHDKNEARMILNHKEAFTFVHNHAREFRTLTRKNLEELHKILVLNMSVAFGLRSKAVGVTGSKYRPLDNQYQIGEAIEALSTAMDRMTTPYGKALLALLGIGYIQPFEDGNKRTSRLMANALLMAHDCAPLSYRSVDENEYREAMLVFYEINSIMSFKKIFINQYDFAAKNYSVK